MRTLLLLLLLLLPPQFRHFIADVPFIPGDHVDILGRSSLNDLILRIAGGRGDQIEENLVSNIREYADKVKIYEEE